MARKRTSKFGVADGLFDNSENTKDSIERKKQAQEVQEAQHVPNSPEKKTIGSTQGRKGEHLKRINMAFSDENYDFITVEGRRSGARSTTAFVNQIIDEYRKRGEK